MSRLFISHSGRNDDWALALRDWLVREGWSGEHDIFLDVDSQRGIAAGEKWVKALEDAATRCEAVLFLVSEVWLASKWCHDEYQLANKLNKKLFALLIDDVALDRLPGGLTAQWQVVSLRGEPAERFVAVHPRTQKQSPLHIARAGLQSLKRGLEKAGIGAETFELQPEAGGPFGWRAPYRGLEALEPEDAAVFFGRNADMMRGIDALRGLAVRKRLLVILGASGAGKSSFLRAGLWPRLLRDDSQWLPLRAIRASRGGAIEGAEGLLVALEEVHTRFALGTTRAALRDRLATPARFVALLRELRQAAARRTNLDQPPYPLPVLCLDQGEELFAADAGAESAKLLQLARAAIDAGEALLLVTIRSDSYGRMQSAEVLAEIEQVALPLGPVPQGEMARIIREPSEVLRHKAGPQAPVFDPAVVEQLQKEVAGEGDALPLLAFVLQRLMREYQGAATIGAAELHRTGGVAAAIEREAEAALADAGYGPGHAERRDVLRRLFIPRLARIDRESKAPQRRVAHRSELPLDLAPLARALTERRLVVASVAGEAEHGGAAAATLEVAHEALLRRWPTLADLLAEDRDALLLLDGVFNAAKDWEKADADKQDFIVHRGSRLADAQKLTRRGPEWRQEIDPAQPYLDACEEREATERKEKEEALAREQERLVQSERAQAEIASEQEKTARLQDRTARLQRRGRRTLVSFATVVAMGVGLAAWQLHTNFEQQKQLDHGKNNLLAELATSQRLQGRFDSALRLSTHAARVAQGLGGNTGALARAALASTVWQSQTRTALSGHEAPVQSAAFSPDGARVVTASEDGTARVFDAATGKEIAALRGQGFVRSAAFSPDGARVVTASQDQTARVFDAATGKEIAALRGHEGVVLSAAFCPDGARVVTASMDRTARVFDAATGKEIVVLRGHEALVLSAAYSPDGARVVTASNDRTARVFDAATGKEIAVLRGHEAPVQSAAYSPDGARVVTASQDRTARVFDAATGKEIAVLRGHEGFVRSAEFSPDGARVVTASNDRTARVWDVRFATMSAQHLVAEVCLRRLRGLTSFSRDDMRLAGYADDATPIDACAGIDREAATLNR